jgi:alpha-tubulin suppressor-like RCC1 family protein
VAGMRVGVARLRALVFAATLTVTTLAVTLSVATPAQAVAKPVIGGLSAYPRTVASGGTAGISATVTAAATCTLSSPKSKPIAGLEGSFPCGEGSAMRVVAMPQNKGKQPVTYTLTLTVHAALGKAEAKAKVAITVLPEETQYSDKQLIAAGFLSTCAVLTQGTERGRVLCWGSRALGDLGDEGAQSGYSSTPVAVANINNAVEVAAGGEHTCALLSTGHIKCWGASIGLGNGIRMLTPGDSTPVAVVNIANAVQITGGYADTCALLYTGHVDCWGLNNVGQLGRNTVDPVEFPAPVEIPALANAVEVTAGRETTCARVEGGAVECWGGDGHGQLGDGTNGLEHFTPFPVAEVRSVSGIAAGENHLCAVVHEASRPAGQVKCWGWDASGQLGDDNLGYIRKPEDVLEAQRLPVSGVLQATAGYEHSCALFKGGTIECWGGDAKGQLGDGAPKEKETVAVPVSGPLEHVVEIDASYQHTCALLEDGTIKCWGSDAAGELGNGTTEPFSTKPVTVVGFPPTSAAARRAAARRKAHRKIRRHKPHR